MRRITEADRELFITMAREFYSTDAVLAPIPEEHHAKTFDELMRSDVYAECHILTADGRDAGYALLSKTWSQEAGGMVVWLEEFYVLPEFRGRGLGSSFMSYMHEHIPAARYRLEVEDCNTGAIALYKRMGYETLPYVQMVRDVKE